MINVGPAGVIAPKAYFYAILAAKYAFAAIISSGVLPGVFGPMPLPHSSEISQRAVRHAKPKTVVGGVSLARAVAPNNLLEGSLAVGQSVAVFWPTPHGRPLLLKMAPGTIPTLLVEDASANIGQGQSPSTPTPSVTPLPAVTPGSQTPAAQGNPATPQTPPPSQPPAAQLPPPQVTPGFVTNVFVDTDIKTALSEAASQAGVTIIVDDSIKEQNINIEFKNTPIRDVLDRLALLIGGVWKEKSPGVFLFSTGKSESPLFYEFAVTRRYVPSNVTVESLAALLPPSLKDYVQSDKLSNTVTITAPEQKVDNILRLIKAIDAPYRQIVVEAVVAEVDANKSSQFGFSWSWRNFSQSSSLGLQYAQVSSSDVAQVMALIGKGEASLRANPRLSALEGHEAMISVGQETYFPVITSGNAQFQSAQVQLIRTGVILKFTGFIGDDGMITLVLNPEVSDDFQTIATAPTTKIRRLSSTVRIKAGETIAIGGLVQENISDTKNKVPLLGDIPWIGTLFRNQTTTHRKLETIILVTPYLTENGAGIRGEDSSRPLLTPPISVPAAKSGTEQPPILPGKNTR